MNQQAIRKRLLRILEGVPDLKTILLSTDPVPEKRTRLRYFLSDTLFSTFEDDPAIPPLEWILTRNAVNVFRSLLATRSERLAGFSLLEYLDDLIHKESYRGMERPSPGFFDELDHLIRAVGGKTGVYRDKVPAFVRHQGRKAAKLRSADLSRMARNARRFMDRYDSGLGDEARRRRSRNKARIIKYFNASDVEWDDWRWHTGHIIRDPDTLGNLVGITDADYRAVDLARKHKIPFGITPYYLSLMDEAPGEGRDAAVRAQVIPPVEYVTRMREHRACDRRSMDFMIEHDTSPIEGITRRYPNIVILKPVITCPQICVYCQRNWEIEDVHSPNAAVSKGKLEKALAWIEKTPEINEVLVTGGDPFLLYSHIYTTPRPRDRTI